MPSFGISLIWHAVGVGGHEEQRQPLVALGDVAVGAGEQQDVVGGVRGRAPRLIAVQHPAAVDPGGGRAHATEDVRSAAGLGEADREAVLALA